MSSAGTVWGRLVQTKCPRCGNYALLVSSSEDEEYVECQYCGWDPGFEEEYVAEENDEDGYWGPEEVQG